MYLELIVQAIAVFAIILPILITRYSKEQKLKKSTYFLEVVKAYDEVTHIITEKKQSEENPLLITKLEGLQKELKAEMLQDESTKFQPYLLMVALTTFIGFNQVYAFIGNSSAKSKTNLNNDFLHIIFGGSYEGLMKSTSIQLMIWLCIFTTTTVITFQLSKFLKSKIKNFWLYNCMSFGIYLFILLVISVSVVLSIQLLDPFTR